MTSTVAGALSALLLISALLQQELARVLGADRWQRRATMASVPLTIIFVAIVAARLLALL